ncbi:MAG TPA: quinone-dependent dihydroorotate dehydrogenase, partial [Candidatus Saccharimonadales bacterium]|nr:quinone-dependent dihydroorotate dehydrogenase [Candidatus Saccharimonadales bacterium]
RQAEMTSFNFYRLLRPFLFLIDPEKAHHLALMLLKMGAGPHIKNDALDILKTRVCGLNFPNPVGLAAGFDKQAEVMDEMFGFGFGFVELGSITPRPQSGNAKPRLFRIAEAEAIINRFGFNSDGFDVCQRRIIAHYDASVQKSLGILGINIGKNKDSTDAAADYTVGIKKFAPYAHYLTVNISSPNTPGLRDLQEREKLAGLLEQVMAMRNACAKKPPLFVKVAPDQTTGQLADIAEVALASGVDGIILGNTTVTRPASIPAVLAKETGGLSGKPLFEMSTSALASLYKLTQGKIPLIGCGGIASAQDAYAKILAGASLVQLYTALIFEGPFLVRRVNRELAALLARDGFKSVGEAVGKGT